jgi:hypothetical protein
MIIIFSKNRPMQLECLLRSLEGREHIVIYKSDPQFQTAYNQIQGNLLPEENLKQDIIRCMNFEYVCFMVDDMICFDNSWTWPILKVKETYSLRMHKGNEKLADLYKLSIDGNIYRSKDIIRRIEEIDINTPNELEKRLQGNLERFFTMSYGKGYVTNFNHTRVSSTSHCAYTGLYTLKELNRMFLEGWRIDYKEMNLKPENNLHRQNEYKFMKI